MYWGGVLVTQRKVEGGQGRTRKGLEAVSRRPQRNACPRIENRILGSRAPPTTPSIDPGLR